MAKASGRGRRSDEGETKSDDDDDDDEEHVAIFLIDGSEQSTSEEGDERFNGLRKVNDCDSRAKRRVEVLIDVAKTMAVEGFGWKRREYLRDENIRRRFGCVFYDASNAKESPKALGKKQKKRLGCSLLDVESMFRFYESLNHEEYGTDCAFMTLEQAMRTAVLMFKSTKMEHGPRDVVILNATEGLQNLSVAEDLVHKMEKMNVTRSAVFFHGEYASPSSSCLWPTAIEGLADASGVAAICNLRPHQDMFLRLSKRCLRAELESNNVLHEKSNEDEGRTSHAVAEHDRSFTSKSTKYELDGDATERKLMEATRRDKILESNRVQQNAMFPTNLNDDYDVSTAEQKQENQRGVPLQYAENCAAQFSKFDVLEERLGGINTNTSLRVPILIAPKKKRDQDTNQDDTEESSGKENRERDLFIHHVDVNVDNIPKVLEALFKPLLVLTNCSRMRIDKSKKVRPLHDTSGDIIVRQEYFLGNKCEPKVIIEFRKTDGSFDRIASFNRSASKSISLIWPLKNADARVFYLKHELAKYKKFFYFESEKSNAERVAQFRAILENPPTLEELSGIESSKALRDMALAAPSLLRLLCVPETQRTSLGDDVGNPSTLEAPSNSASKFTLEQYEQLELEQKERRRRIRAALTKQKKKNTEIVRGKEEEKTKSDQDANSRQAIAEKLQALRDELELRLKEAEEKAKTAAKKIETTTKNETSQSEEENVNEERRSDKDENKDRRSKKVNSANLLSFFA
jgi:hypothetical protein